MRARTWRLLLAGLFGLRALTFAAVAHAQTPSPDAAPSEPAATPPSGPAPQSVSPPTLKRNDGAAYPRQAIDDGVTQTVEVPLILEIDAAGKVTRAVVEKPVGHGFDEAAVAAAEALEFEPAMRVSGGAIERSGGVKLTPVASRIRFVYRFTPPPAVLAGQVLTMVGSRPIAGATVTARDADGAERTATTDATGAWRIEGLRAGTYHLVVAAPGMTPHEADEQVKAGEEASAIDRLEVPKPAAAADAGADEDVQEVEVKGDKPPREVTKRTLDQREINRIPGTGGDALRSLQNLPGVARTPGFSGLLVVRGAAPTDSQYFIDGTPVPQVYHFGGLASVVPTELVNQLDFYPGNFSTQYGRAMGAIVDVGLAAPESDRVHAMVEANLIDTRFVVQGPVFDTGWSFTVAGRRSWFDVWLAPVLQDLSAGTTVAPVYYDYQALVEKHLSKHETFRLALFGSDDRLSILLKSPVASEPDLSGFGDHTGFIRAQALYTNRVSDQTDLRANVAVGQDYVNFNAGSLVSYNQTDTPITSRVEVAEKLDRRLTMNVGLDFEYAPYTVSVVGPPLPKPGQPPPGPFSGQQQLTTNVSSSFFEPAVYTEWEATPWDGTRLVPGLRLDYTKDTGAWDVSPRVVLRQDVAHDPRTTIKAGAGLFTQPPSPTETNPVFGMSGLISNRAYQYDVGVEHDFSKQIDGSIEGFYKLLDHLVVSGLGNTGSGDIYGAEVFLRYKPDERFFGWLTYTLSRSERREAPGMPLTLFQYDETHVLTILGSYRLGRGWEFGARFRLASGYMYTPQTYGFYDENVGTYQPLQAYPEFGSRLPLFHSLDLRVDKTWKRPWGTFGLYLDVINVYNNANADGVSYDFNSTHSSFANDLPFLPSLGLRVDL
jgi:TonB family protein